MMIVPAAMPAAPGPGRQGTPGTDTADGAALHQSGKRPGGFADYADNHARKPGQGHQTDHDEPRAPDSQPAGEANGEPADEAARRGAEEPERAVRPGAILADPDSAPLAKGGDDTALGRAGQPTAAGLPGQNTGQGTGENAAQKAEEKLPKGHRVATAAIARGGGGAGMPSQQGTLKAMIAPMPAPGQDAGAGAMARVTQGPGGAGTGAGTGGLAPALQAVSDGALRFGGPVQPAPTGHQLAPGAGGPGHVPASSSDADRAGSTARTPPVQLDRASPTPDQARPEMPARGGPPLVKAAQPNASATGAAPAVSTTQSSAAATTATAPPAPPAPVTAAVAAAQQEIDAPLPLTREGRASGGYAMTVSAGEGGMQSGLGAEPGAAMRNAGVTFNASGAMSGAEAARSIGGRELVDQILPALQRASGGRVELTLSPAELGRVEITLQARDGAMSVSLAAERPETLELLRRHIDQLAEDMRQLGFGELAFSFADGSSHGGAGDDGGDGNGTGANAGATPGAGPAQADAAAGHPATAHDPSGATGAAHLDLRL